MPTTIEYSNNPNEETAFVTPEGGQRTRTVLTVPIDGTVKYPDNPNNTKVSVTVDGVERKAVAVYNLGEGGGGGGAVSSVNGKTGAVVLNAKDVAAVPQYTTMPTADSTNVGEIAQFVGTTDATYTNGYFYVNKPTYSDSSATISQTTGSGLTDLAVDVATFESAEQPSGDESVPFTAVVISENVTYSKNTVSDPNDYMLSRVVGWTGTKQDFNIQIETVDENGNAQGLILGPTGGGIWLQITQQEMIDNNVSITNVSASEIIYATYIAGSTSWTKGGDTVTLADYGISFTGDPADGDVLTVAYTASAISGYSWNQIDVQPSSGGGQTIEYTDVDYVYGTDPSEMSLYFEFANLPTGDYYFYLKSKKQVGSWSGSSYKYQTNKISFHWDSTWEDGTNVYDMSKLIGVTPVLDGDYYGGGDGDNMFTNTSSPINVYYVGDSSNKYALKLNSGGLRAATGSVSEDMPAAYKVSKLYGGVAPATLTANKIGRWDVPTGYNNYADGGNTTPIIRPTNLPDKELTFSYTVSSFATTDNVMELYGGNFAKNTTSATIMRLCCICSACEFIGEIIYTPNGKTEQHITKATGAFDASRFYVNLNTSSTYLTIDNAAFAALQNQNENVRICLSIFGASGVSTPSGSLLQATTLGTKLPFATSRPTYVMDTPTIHEYKGIVQYVGETDANYTKGYFYEADGTVVTVPASLTCTETTSTGTTITCTGSDVEGLVNKLSSITGWSPDDTKQMLNDSSYQWTTNGDSVNPDLYWSAYGTWYGQDATDILAYFTFSPTLSTTVSWATSNYQDGHDELQNGAWVQKDVQPSGGLQNTATGLNSLSVLGTATTQANSINIGAGSDAAMSVQQVVIGTNAYGRGTSSVGIGYNIKAQAEGDVVIGANAEGDANNHTGKIIIGYGAKATAAHAIQFGSGDFGTTYTNSDANTFKVGNANGNFEIMDANGNLPADRLASTTGLADGNYRLRLTMASGVPTLSWVAE